MWSVCCQKENFFSVIERVKHFSLPWISKKTFWLLRLLSAISALYPGLFALVLCFTHLNLTWSLCSYFRCLIVSSCFILARDVWHENHRFSAHTTAAEKKKRVPERKQAAALPLCFLWIMLESQSRITSSNLYRHSTLTVVMTLNRNKKESETSTERECKISQQRAHLSVCWLTVFCNQLSIMIAWT